MTQRILDNLATIIHAPNGINYLREMILQLAVQGKLVPQDENDEPAAVLLAKIQAEKERLIQEGKIKRQKPLPAITEEEKPFELPKGWEWVRLGDYTHIFSGNAFNSEDFNNLEGILTVKITNIGVGEFIKTNDFLPRIFLDNYKSFLTRENDLLIALTRPYIADGLKVCTCPKEYDDALLNQRVAAIRAFHSKDFLFFFLKSKTVLQQYQERFNGNGLQPNLKMSDITELLTPFPPLQESHRINLKVSFLLSLCDQLESKLTQARQTQEQFALTATTMS